MSTQPRILIAAALCLLAADLGFAGDERPAPAARRLGVLTDIRFRPAMSPSPDGAPVEQVVVTSGALEASFQPFADHETFRGVPTVVRTTSWIDANYAGADRAARIRTFLRDAYDEWGTVYALLGGDVEHVPTRYVPWDGAIIPTDLYYECLDREWNEDGDAVYGEPLVSGGLESFVADTDWAPDGKLWFATNVGACYLELGQFTQFRVADGLPDDRVLGVDVASDNTVWIRVLDSVARWNGSSWASWDASDGIPGNQINVVLGSGHSDAWIGTDSGLAHWDGATWTTWTTSDTSSRC